MPSFVLLLFFIVIVYCVYVMSISRVIVGGAQSKSEAFAVAELERLTGAKLRTVNPSWLRWRNPFTGKTSRLELDGYNEKLKIALEFSGPLHTKWFPETESYKEYITRVMKDESKKEICKKHGVCLIVLDMSLPRRHYRDYLASRLYDCGKCARPDNYIDVQDATPYRNEKMDNELFQ